MTAQRITPEQVADVRAYMRTLEIEIQIAAQRGDSALAVVFAETLGRLERFLRRGGRA